MEFWQSIGTLDFILDVIKEGYKIPFICIPPPKHYFNTASALREADFVDQAIAELLADNRVEELSSPPVILNPLTVSVQASGKKRLILDLRHINLHVFKQKFKCKGLHTIRDVSVFKTLFCFFFRSKVWVSPCKTFFLSIAHFWLSPGTLARV